MDVRAAGVGGSAIVANKVGINTSRITCVGNHLIIVQDRHESQARNTTTLEWRKTCLVYRCHSRMYGENAGKLEEKHFEFHGGGCFEMFWLSWCLLSSTDVCP